jgi:hypothetical protein
VKQVLGRFEDRLTRVEIHLSDVNSKKFGTQDKRCLVEARPAGGQPVAVTEAAASVVIAVRAALSKLRRRLETSFARAGKDGRTAREKSASSAPASRKKTESKPRVRAANATAVAAAAAGPTSATDGPRPKRKAIFQARRKSWPKS